MNFVDTYRPADVSERSPEANRLLHPLPRYILNAIDSHLKTPDFTPHSKTVAATLSSMLSAYTGLPKSTHRIFVGREAALDAAARICCRPHTNLLIAGPLDNHFETKSEIHDTGIIHHYSPSPFIADPDDIVEKADDSTAAIYLANPNPLTGTVYSTDEIKYLLEHLPDTNDCTG